MKRITFILILCVLCVSIPFSVTAENSESVSNVEDVEDKIFISTDFLINTEDYCSEQAVDFYGVPVLEIKAVYDYSSEESLQNWIDRAGNRFVYIALVDRSMSVQEACNILKNKEGIVNCGVHCYEGHDMYTDLVPGFDYVEGELVLEAYFPIDLSLYTGEESYDFYGVKIIEIENSFCDTPEAAFEQYGVTAYLIKLDPSVDELEAIELLDDYDWMMPTYSWIFHIDDPIILDGDVNGDGIVDAFDCLIVKGIYFETYEATEDELARADINGDGEIDMFDYLEVKAIYFEQ